MLQRTVVSCLLFFSSIVCSSEAPITVGSCDLSAGMADSYILALSSQTGFCQTTGYEKRKPECMELSRNSYEAKYLVLHGLWPNQIACGQHYGFCGTEPKPTHCRYKPLELAPEVKTALEQVMPSYRYGSCLERHEWNKHGSCQTLGIDDYFTIASKLTREINDTSFGQFLAEHTGKSVRLTELRDALSKAFGGANGGKFYLGCKNGILLDVYVSLPAYIDPALSLLELIQDARDYDLYDSCPRNVQISNFYNKSLRYSDEGVLHREKSSSNVLR